METPTRPYFLVNVNGKGTVTGACNWIANAAGPFPETMTNTLRGEDPGLSMREHSTFACGQIRR